MIRTVRKPEVFSRTKFISKVHQFSAISVDDEDNDNDGSKTDKSNGLDYGVEVAKMKTAVKMPMKAIKNKTFVQPISLTI